MSHKIRILVLCLSLSALAYANPLDPEGDSDEKPAVPTVHSQQDCRKLLRGFRLSTLLVAATVLPPIIGLTGKHFIERHFANEKIAAEHFLITNDGKMSVAAAKKALAKNPSAGAIGTAVEQAVGVGNWEVAKLLVSDPSYRDARNSGIVMDGTFERIIPNAIMRGPKSFDFLKFLIDQEGADPNISQGRLFWESMRFGDKGFDFVKFLLQKGGNPNLESGRLLRLAIEARRPDWVRYLISHGAEKNYDSGRILSDLMKQEMPELFEEIIRGGSVDAQGLTFHRYLVAIHLDKKNRKPFYAPLLLEHTDEVYPPFIIGSHLPYELPALPSAMSKTNLTSVTHLPEFGKQLLHAILNLRELYYSDQQRELPVEPEATLGVTDANRLEVAMALVLAVPSSERGQDHPSYHANLNDALDVLRILKVDEKKAKALIPQLEEKAKTLKRLSRDR